MAGGVQALNRGLRMRCPTCGTGDLFTSFFTLRDRCLGCGTAFEREEGYFIGAMIVLIGVTEALFGLWFVGGMLLTWPNVPWTTLLIGGIVLNLVFPIVGYPWSKTTWMGLHDAFVSEEPSKQAEAITALDARRRAAAIAARDQALTDARPVAPPDELDGSPTDDPHGGAGDSER